MGGGNGQKSATARERNLAKKLKEQKQKNREQTKGKIEADKAGLKCKICMTCFMVTANVRCCLSVYLALSVSLCRHHCAPDAIAWRVCSRLTPSASLNGSVCVCVA